jgi:hypothetical protein
VGLSAASEASPDESRCAYVAGRVFDGLRVLTGHAVTVSGGTVTGVVPTGALPPGVPTLTEPGCTLLPGLIDAHTHFLRWQGPQFLAWGVTTIRDTGNALEWILRQREESARRPWPRILCVGPLLDGPSPFHPLVSMGCPDRASAVAAVRTLAAAGVDAIKLYVRLDPGWIADMARESHAAALRVSMHCTGAGAAVAARAGVDEFHHLDGVLDVVWPGHPPGWLDAWGEPGLEATLDKQRELADLVAERGTTATPTLAYWRSQWRGRMSSRATREERRLVPPELVRLQSPGPDAAGAAKWHRALVGAQGFVGLLLERDVRVLAGTDTPCGALAPGLSLWRELSLLVEAGMSPIAALRAATSGAADFLGKRRLGRLREGCAADMVLVRGDPTARLDPSPEVVATIRDGVLHRPADLLAPAGAGDSDVDGDPWMEQFRAHAAGR